MKAAAISSHRSRSARRTFSPARAVAVCALTAFLAQDCALAAELAAAPRTFSTAAFRVAAPYAKIQETHEGRDGRFIIHLQDAHNNLSAQENLVRTIEDLATRYGITDIFVEGGTRDDSLDYLRPLADRSVRERVARKYLVNGEINAAEYVSIATDLPVKLWGVEERSLYRDNLERYARLTAGREDVSAYLAQMRRRADRLERKMYPKDLSEFEAVLERFERKEISFTEYQSALAERAALYRIDLGRYPAFRSLSRLREAEEKIDFEAADRQQRELTEELLRRRGQLPEMLREAAQHASRLRSDLLTPLTFYETLLAEAAAAGVDVGAYPQIGAYVEYLRRHAAIDFTGLVDENDAIVRQVYRAALTDPDALRLWETSEHLALTEKLFSLEIAKPEFDRYAARRSDARFETLVSLAFLNRRLDEMDATADVLPYSDVLDRSRELAETFYRTNETRDVVFVEKTLERMKERGARVALLVTGGYHTPNLTRLMKQKGLSYAVVMPYISGQTNRRRYEEILLGQLGEGHPLLAQRTVTAGDASRTFDVMRAAERPYSDTVRRIEIDFHSAAPVSIPVRTGPDGTPVPPYGARLSAAAALDRLERSMRFDPPAMRQTIVNFQRDARKGIEQDPSSTLRMFNSFIPRRLGNETGRFLALDLGGTNFRVIVVDMQDGRITRSKVYTKEDFPEFELTPALITGEREPFFDFIADGIRRAAAAEGLDPAQTYPLGFSFAFPVRQEAVDVGRLVEWVKGFDVKNVVGEDVVRLLNEALARRQIGNVRVVALVNDTVATLTANPEAELGAILGTGTNGAYWGPDFAYNTEWGGFRAFPDGVVTDVDRALDAASSNPGRHLLEKMVAGKYLGEVARRVLSGLAAEGLFEGQTYPVLETPDALETRFLTAIADDASAELASVEAIFPGATAQQRQAVRRVAEIVLARSARIFVSAVSAILSEADPELTREHLVAVDGSLFEKSAAYRRLVEEATVDVWGAKAPRVRYALAKDATGTGAAVVAAILQSNQRAGGARLAAPVTLPLIEQAGPEWIELLAGHLEIGRVAFSSQSERGSREFQITDYATQDYDLSVRYAGPLRLIFQRANVGRAGVPNWHVLMERQGRRQHVAVVYNRQAVAVVDDVEEILSSSGTPRQKAALLRELIQEFPEAASGARLSDLEETIRETAEASRLRDEGRYLEADAIYRRLLDQTVDDDRAHFEMAVGLAESLLRQTEALDLSDEAAPDEARRLNAAAENALNQAVDRVVRLEDDQAYRQLDQLAERLDSSRERLERLTVQGPPNVIPEGAPVGPAAPPPARVFPLPIQSARQADFESALSDTLGRAKLRQRARLLLDEIQTGRLVGREEFVRFFRARISTAVRDGRPAAEAVADRFAFPDAPPADPARDLRRRLESLARSAQRAYEAVSPSYRLDQMFLHQTYLLPRIGSLRLVEIAAMRPDDYARLRERAAQVPDPAIRADALLVIERARTLPNAQYRRLAEQYRQTAILLAQLPQEPDTEIETDPLPPPAPEAGARLANRREVDAKLTQLEQQIPLDTYEIDLQHPPIGTLRGAFLQQLRDYFDQERYVPSLQQLALVSSHVPPDVPASALIGDLSDQLDRLAYATFLTAPEFRVAEPRADAIRQAQILQEPVLKTPLEKIRPLKTGDVHVLPADLAKLEALTESTEDEKLRERLRRMLGSIREKSAPNAVDPGLERELVERARGLSYVAALGVGGQSRRGGIFANYMHYVEGAVGKVRLLDYRLAQFAGQAQGFQNLRPVLIQSPFTETRIDRALIEGRADLSHLALTLDGTVERVNAGLTHVFNADGTIWREGSVHGLAVPSHGDAVIQLWPILDELIEDGYEYYGFYNMNVINSVPRPEHVAYLDYRREQARLRGEPEPWILFAMTMPIGEKGGLATRGIYDQYPEEADGILQISEGWTLKKEDLETLLAQPENYPLFSTNAPIVHIPTLRQKFFGSIPAGHLRRSYVEQHPDFIQRELLPAIRESVADYGDPDPRNRLGTNIEHKTDPDDALGHRQIAQTSTMLGSIVKMDANAVLLAVPRDEAGDYYEFKTRPQVVNLERSVRRFSQEGRLALRPAVQASIPLTNEDVIRWFLEDNIYGEATLNGQRDFRIVTPFGERDIPHDQPFEAIRALHDLLPGGEYYRNVRVHLDEGVVIVEAAYGEDGGARLASAAGIRPDPAARPAANAAALPEVSPIPSAPRPGAETPRGARLAASPDQRFPLDSPYRLTDEQLDRAALYLLHLAADLTNWQTPGRLLGRQDEVFESHINATAAPIQEALRALGLAKQAQAPLLRSDRVAEAIESLRTLGAETGPIRLAIERLVESGQLRRQYVESSTGATLLRRTQGIIDYLEGRQTPGGARLSSAPPLDRRQITRQLRDLERIVRHSPTRGISDYRRAKILLAALYGGRADHHEFTGVNRPWKAHRFTPLTGLRTLRELAGTAASPFTPRQRQILDDLDRAAVSRLAELGVNADDFGELARHPEFQNPSLRTFLGEDGRLDRAAALAGFTAQDLAYLRSFEEVVEVPVPQSVPGRREVLYPLALRIRHNSERGEIRQDDHRGPTKGGTRFVTALALLNDPVFVERFQTLESAQNPDGTRRYSLEELRVFLRTWVEDEAAALAVGMTVKTADSKLPYGGAKGLILFADVFENPDGTREIRDFPSTDPLFRARLIRNYAGQLFDQGKIGYDVDVPAPDVGSRPLDMDLMTDEVLRRVITRAIRDRSIQTWEPTFRDRILDIHQRGSEGRNYDAYLAGTFYLTAVTDQLRRLRELGVAAIPDWFKPLANQVASFTSKTVPNGGSIFRDASTGFGVVHVAREVVRREPGLLDSLRQAGRPVTEDAPLRGVTVKVQGFGGVAIPAIERLVRRPGARRPEDRGEGAVVQAIAEAAGIVYKADGFTPADVETLRALKNATGGFALLNSQPAYTIQGASLITEDDFLRVPTDLFIPAALENAVNETNVDRLEARVVVEAANGAVSNGAYDRLAERGVFLIPDSLANAGGVTVSYFEWRQNLLNESWDEASVRSRQEAQQTEAVESIYRVRERYGVDLRTAADIYAFQSVLESRLGSDTARAGARLASAAAVVVPVDSEPLDADGVRRAEELADRLAAALRVTASDQPRIPVDIAGRTVVFALSAAPGPAGQAAVTVTASLAPAGPPQALLLPDFASFRPVFADRLTDVRQARADLSLQRSAAVHAQAVPVSSVDFEAVETRLAAVRAAGEEPALKDLRIWNPRNANFLNAWGQNLAPALKAAPEGGTFALSVPLETTFDAERGYTLSADLEQAMTLLAAQLKQQNVNGNVLVLFTHVGPLADEARNRIAARLQSAEAAAGANRIQLRLAILPERATLVEGVLGGLDPKLQLVGLSLGVDVALPRESVGYDAAVSSKLPIYLFGVQLPKMNEIVPTAGLLVIGTMAFSEAISVPADLKPFITKTDSGYGFVIFLVRPQPVTPEIERVLANRRATEASA